MNRQSLASRFHVLFYRLSKGKLGGSIHGAPVLLLTTTGRKTGKKRATPLLYMKEGNMIVIVASNGGRDWEPSWWTNLRRNPLAELQIKGEKWAVKAEEASTEEKARLWPVLTRMYPMYNHYQRRTKRVIPVVILTPSGTPHKNRLQ